MPPSKIKVLEPLEQEKDAVLVEPIKPYKTQAVYEIWKLYLDNYNEAECAYIVISAHYKTSGYGKGEWENLQYEGFYTTVEEAENEIEGYLKS